MRNPEPGGGVSGPGGGASNVSPDGQWVAAPHENTGAAIAISFPDGQVVQRPELGGVGSVASLGR